MPLETPPPRNVYPVGMMRGLQVYVVSENSTQSCPSCCCIALFLSKRRQETLRGGRPPQTRTCDVCYCFATLVLRSFIPQHRYYRRSCGKPQRLGRNVDRRRWAHHSWLPVSPDPCKVSKVLVPHVERRTRKRFISQTKLDSTERRVWSASSAQVCQRKSPCLACTLSHGKQTNPAKEGARIVKIWWRV